MDTEAVFWANNQGAIEERFRVCGNLVSTISLSQGSSIEQSSIVFYCHSISVFS